ncbi:MAG: AAA family ATPase [Nitrospinota bacterium]
MEKIELLRKKVASAQTGRLEVGFLLGERGIGKSSLASFVRFLADRDHQMVGIHTFLGGVTSLDEMVRRAFDRLLKESVEKTWHEKVVKFFGNHVREVGLFGVSVEFGAPAQDLKRMVHDFALVVRNLIARVQDDKKGVLLVLDDINGLASSQDFANWLKSLVDEIATSQKPFPICLLLVGLEERRQALIELQPSLARVFELVEIAAWSPDETTTFYRDAFSRVGIKVEDEALGILSQFAGGLPVLAHEIGDAAFLIDTDSYIDVGDASNAVFAAADIVGRKHLQPQVFQAIRSPRYRAILRRLARDPFGASFRRQDVLKGLGEDEAKVLDNFLRRMTQLAVINPDREAGPGAYQFKSSLNYLYFRLEAQRAQKGSNP